MFIESLDREYRTAQMTKQLEEINHSKISTLDNVVKTAKPKRIVSIEKNNLVR